MALSVTATATKIDVISTDVGGNTLAEVVDAANVSLAGKVTIDNTDPNAIIYTINCTAYTLLEISSGAKVTFEEFDELRWEKTTAATYALTIVSGGEIVVEEGFTFDFGYAGGQPISTSAYDNQRYAYIQFQGKVTFNGTSSNHITMKNYRIWYVTYAMRYGIYMHYVDLRGFSVQGHYALYMFLQRNYDDGSVVDMQYLDFTDTRNYGYVLVGNGDMSTMQEDRITLSQWTVDDIYYFRSVSSTKKFANFHFARTRCQILGGGSKSGKPYNHDRMVGEAYRNISFQPYTMFDNCTWEAMTSYCVEPSGDALVYFKECTFDVAGGGTASPSYPQYSATIIYKDCTFPGFSREYFQNHGSAVFYGRELSITVKDLSNNPIDKAVVSITQAEGKEWLSGHTNSDGELLNIHSNAPVVVEKQALNDNYVIPSFSQWSDDIAGGQYHVVQVSKEGYQTETYQLEMTEDRIITVNLTPIAKTNTVVYDSTLYDSTIY